MRIVILFFVSVFFSTVTVAQQLRVNETRFIIGDSICGASINYSIPTSDHGLLLFGGTDCNHKGDIQSTIDSNALGVNALICKMDSNMHISWTKVYGGSQSDEARCACATSDGGYAVLALSLSNDGDVPGIKGSGDIWLIKTDANGNKLWSSIWGSNGSASPISIVETPDHGLVFLGYVSGSGYDVPFAYVNTPFLHDWVLIKTDSLGNKQWSKTIGGTDDEGANGSILVTNDGYYIVSYSNSTDYNCADSSWHLSKNTQTDIVLIKTDTTGNVLWDSTYGGSDIDVVYNAILDRRDSSIVIAGYSQSSDYMVQDHQGNPGEKDCWVLKTDRNGKLLWETTLLDTNTVGGINEAKAVTTTSYGGYAVLGDLIKGNYGQEDVRLFITDSQGHIIANVMAGGGNYEMANTLAKYNDGYALIGSSQSSVFSEGINLNQSPTNGAAFVCYTEYWPVAIQNIDKPKQQLLCYPNPTQNKIRIQLINKDLKGVISVTSNDGKIIYQQQISSAYLDIVTLEWPKGVYIVQYLSGDGKDTVVKINVE